MGHLGSILARSLNFRQKIPADPHRKSHHVSKFPLSNTHYLVPTELLLTALELATLGTLSSNDPLQLSAIAT